MRGLFGLVGLLLALVITGFLVRQQMRSTRLPVQMLQSPSGPDTQTTPAADAAMTSASGTPAQQSQQMQQQFKQAVEGAMQQVRPMPDDQ